MLFLARFSGGAVASFEAARQATGNQNRNTFEINGTKGALKFDFERMNELNFYDATLPLLPRAARVGLAFDVQIVPTLPRDAHDAPLDAVVTESRILAFRRDSR